MAVQRWEYFNILGLEKQQFDCRLAQKAAEGFEVDNFAPTWTESGMRYSAILRRPFRPEAAMRRLTEPVAAMVNTMNISD